MLARATPLEPPHASPARARVLVAALALWAAWMAYALPGPRHAALTALRPWLGSVLAPEPGLRFDDVHARRTEINGQVVLYVEGSLVNAGAARRKIPALVMTLVGEDGRPLYTWKAKAAKPEAAAGASIPFQTRLLSPPEPYRNIAVGFADGS